MAKKVYDKWLPQIGTGFNLGSVGSTPPSSLQPKMAKPVAPATASYPSHQKGKKHAYFRKIHFAHWA
jgi:hypothetical protein